MDQIREGLFTDEDLKQLEGGYSVSDSENDEMGSAMNDIMSAHSFYQNRAAHMRGGSAFGMNDAPVYSPQLNGSPGAPHP